MLIKFLLLFAVGLFLTYPAAVLTTIIEGQSPQAIFSIHLPTSILSYLIVLGITLFVFKGVILNAGRVTPYKIMWPLVFIIALYSLLVFSNLGHADIAGDDYDLAYQAYNLQDGIQAARKAYVISFNTHPPLFMAIKYYWFQLIAPFGLETVPQWGYRGMEGVLGIATILAVYAITKNYWASAILAVNNYMVFLGRVYLREIYLAFFLTLSIYFFQKRNYLVTGFLVACGLLVKTSAIIILPAYLLIMLYQKQYKNILKLLSVILIFYLPVFLYNLLAYVTTGHMDATFSKVFGLAHPFLTTSSPPIANLIAIKNYLIGIYSLPVFIIFIISAVINFRNLYFLILLSSFLYFVFGGPLKEYYLLFPTIPFVILSLKMPKFVIISLFFVSLWYSVSGYSEIRRIYEPSRGWPPLVSQVKNIYQPGDCLIRGQGVNDLSMRAYFQADDFAKLDLLGPNYPHFYKMCDEIESPSKRIEILYNSDNLVQFRSI